MTDVVEVMARGICREKCAFRGEPPCWDKAFAGEPFPPPTCDEPGCFDEARAALAALNEAGYVVVERDELAEVTQYIENGVDNLSEYANCLSREPHLAARLQIAADMTRAMLSAAPAPK